MQGKAEKLDIIIAPPPIFFGELQQAIVTRLQPFAIALGLHVFTISEIASGYTVRRLAAMIPRAAALRAATARTAAFQTPLRRTIPSTRLRSYANFVGGSNGNGAPKPNRPTTFAQLKLDNARRTNEARAQAGLGPIEPEEPDAKEFTETEPTAELNSSTGKETANAESAAEFNRAANPQDNTTPDSQPGPAPPHSRQSRQSSQEESNAYQEEFEGPKSAETNTTPESNQQFGQKPLPDLRQGIPSTFAEEFGKIHEKEAERRDPRTVEEAERQEETARKHGEHEFAGSGRSGGDLPKSAYETSTDRRRNRVANWGFLIMGLFGAAGAGWLGRNWESDEEARRHPDIPSGWGIGIFWDRIQARLSDSLGYYTEPTFPKLLPTMDMAPPYTLVISLEDMMVHSEWSRQHGYRTAKRPGIDYFLRYLSQYYEIVMFTSLPMAQAEPVYRKLDPYHIIMWPLFREATRYHNGDYVKVCLQDPPRRQELILIIQDIAYLNRDPSKVIVLDTSASHVSSQPENAIVLKPWKGDPKDRDLVSYIPFLEHIAAMGVPDVRPAIASFQGKHIPTEYAAREAHARELFNKQLQEERSKRPRRSGGSMLANMLGMKPQPAPGAMIVGDDGTTASEGFEKGLMLTDQIRERGRKGYENLENMIRTEGDKWLKEMEEEEKKLQEDAVKSMKGGMMGWFGGPKADVNEKK